MKILKLIQNFFKDETADIPDDYQEEIGDGHYYLDAPKYFTYSSVKGDFRIFLGPDYFITTWRKKFVVARDLEGKLLWQKHMHGEFAAISPDKTKVVLSAGNRISIHNVSDGQKIAVSNDFGSFSAYLAWTDEEKIISLESDAITILDENLNVLDQIPRETLNNAGYLGSLCLDAYNPNHIYTSDANNLKLLKVDIDKKSIILSHKIGDHPNNISICRNRQLLLTYSDSNKRKPLTIYNASNFKKVKKISCTGKIRGALMPKAEGEDTQYSKYNCTMWEPLPDLSPNQRLLLINDPSGALHLWDVKKDKRLRTFDRKILDYVYDVKWIDNESFLVILNEYKVAKMNIRGREVDFMVKEE